MKNIILKGGIFSFILLSATKVFAGYGLSETGSAAGLPNRDVSLASQIGSVINGALGLIGIVFLILAIYGGFRILLSAGNPESVKKGRDVLIYAVIGMIVITLSFALTGFIFDQFISPTNAPAAAPVTTTP